MKQWSSNIVLKVGDVFFSFKQMEEVRLDIWVPCKLSLLNRDLDVNP